MYIKNLYSKHLYADNSVAIYCMYFIFQVVVSISSGMFSLFSVFVFCVCSFFNCSCQCQFLSAIILGVPGHDFFIGTVYSMLHIGVHDTYLPVMD